MRNLCQATHHDTNLHAFISSTQRHVLMQALHSLSLNLHALVSTMCNLVELVYHTLCEVKCGLCFHDFYEFMCDGGGGGMSTLLDNSFGR